MFCYAKSTIYFLINSGNLTGALRKVSRRYRHCLFSDFKNILYTQIKSREHFPHFFRLSQYKRAPFLRRGGLAAQ